MIIKLMIILAIVFLLLTLYAIVTASAPRTNEDQTHADQEQLEFIAKWRREHPEYDNCQNQKG